MWSVRVFVGLSFLVAAAAGRPAAAATAMVQLLDDGQRVQVTTADGRTTVQPNYRYHALFTPDDPQYPLQWNFAAINVGKAWDRDGTPPLYGGDPSILVAVLDTGVAYENYQDAKQVPDLAGTAIWTNTGEVAGDGLDNDGNGFIDDIHGWDFVNADAHPDDDNGHGTHVTGTIAGTTNNGLAVAGIAFNSTIMPLKVLDAAGDGSTAAIITAMSYAVAKGADIINLSLGGDKEDTALHDAIVAAVNQGVVVVAAAGNDGLGSVNYPARFSETISVGAIQYDQARAPYSNYGPELKLVAPGGNATIDQNGDGQVDGIIQQTCAPGDCSSVGNFYYSGTSQAAAHVSAAVALLEACGATGSTAESALVSTAVDLGSTGRDNEYGAGLIDISAALAATGCLDTSPSPPSAVSATAGAGLTRPVSANHPYPFRRPVFSWTGPAGAVYHLTWSRGKKTLVTVTQTATSYSPRLTKDGRYTLSVATTDNLGRLSDPQTFVYRYRRQVIALGSTGQSGLATLYSSSLAVVRALTFASPNDPRLEAGPLEKDWTDRLIIVDRRAGATLRVVDTKGRTLRRITPFGSAFAGTIDATVQASTSAASLLVASQRTAGAEVRWYSATGKVQHRQLLYATYRGGLTVAAGDLDGDGTDELIVGQTAGPEIRVYGRDGARQQIWRPTGRSYRGGWNVAAADIDGDGREEVVATGTQAASRPKVFILSASGKVRRTWTLKTGLAGPLDLQAVDLDGDGRDELVLISEPDGRLLQVRSWTGAVRRQLRLDQVATSVSVLP